MATIYPEDDFTLLRHVKAVALPDNYEIEILEKKANIHFQSLVKESNKKMMRSTKRIMERAKVMRQVLSKVVIKGTRSDSGKIDFEFYEKLVEIWGGSPNVSKISYGATTDQFNSSSSDDDFDIINSDSSINGATASGESNNVSRNKDLNVADVRFMSDDEDFNENVTEEAKASQRKIKNNVPSLIANKRSA